MRHYLHSLTMSAFFCAALSISAKDLYTVNFPIETTVSHASRRIVGVSFVGDQGGQLSLAFPGAAPSTIYLPQLTPWGAAKPGEKISPDFQFVGNWMHGYVYLDYGRDGGFESAVTENGIPSAGSDLVA